MSKEQEPTRTRKELREAGSEQRQGTVGYPSVPVVPAPSNPAGPAGGAAGPDDRPAATGPANDRGDDVPRERSSQTRARDRAALRAYKELVDAAPEQQANQLPSRRALRRAQLDAERAPVTSINHVVPPAKVRPAPTVPPVNAVPPAKLVTAVPPAKPVSAATSAKPAAVQPAPTQQGDTGTVGQMPAASRRPRAGRRAADTVPDALPQEAGHQEAAPSHGVNAVAPAAFELSTDTVAAPATSAMPRQPAPGPVPALPYPSVSVGPATSAGQPPSTEELRVLAEQRAQAERAAVLDQRAQTRERLAQESAKSRRTVADPTATNNLAMVTPMEFLNVPGMDRPVMRPPSTTHVPIVTRSTPKLGASRKKPASASGPAAARSRRGKSSAGKSSGGKASPGKPASPRDANVERFDAALSARAVHRPGPGNRPLTGGRSNTLKRAQAMAAGDRPAEPAASPVEPARPGSVTRTQMPPMPAEYAHGLEPLDAITAGLGRTKRNLLVQWGSIILGGAAVVVGVVMFITALAR